MNASGEKCSQLHISGCPFSSELPEVSSVQSSKKVIIRGRKEIVEISGGKPTHVFGNKDQDFENTYLTNNLVEEAVVRVACIQKRRSRNQESRAHPFSKC